MDQSGNDVVSTNQEQQLFKERVNQFVQQQKEKQKLLEQQGQIKNLTIEELIAQKQALSTETFENFFKQKQVLDVPEETVGEVKQAFGTMKTKINQLTSLQRFFILETMDFFNNKISLRKLLPAILLFNGEEQKKAIYSFIRPTFLSISNNVEILASTDVLFDPKTIYIERGSLYIFVSDIANLLLPLFKQEYIERLRSDEITSPVEILKPLLGLGKSGIKGVGFAGMIEDVEQIRRIILAFVVTLQSHDCLFNYAVKRHDYYKYFLSGITAQKRFHGVEPLDVSKVLAGCFLENKQLKPDDTLIDGMIDSEQFSSTVTIQARSKFVDQLSPSNVYDLINQTRHTIQNLSKPH